MDPVASAHTGPPPPPSPLPHAAGAGEGSAEPVSTRPGASTEAESRWEDAPSGEGTGKEVTCVPAGREYKLGSAEVCGVQGQGGSSKGCQASTGVWVSFSKGQGAATDSEPGPGVGLGAW